MWTVLRASPLFEDEAALVLNKPTGISVMGERHDTDLVRLAEESGETVFPVHRIDKATSGAILFAKELRFHGELTRQFNRRTVGKTYLAITRSTGRPERGTIDLPERGTIDLPLSVGRKNRVRVAGNRDDIAFDPGRRTWSLGADAEPRAGKSYPSVTTFTVLWRDDRHSLLAVTPITGRRHQIRVHLAWIGHPILGDPLFEREPAADRTFLHSWRLSFDRAVSPGDRVSVAATPEPGFWAPVRDGLPSSPEALLADAERTARREQSGPSAGL